MDDAVFIKLCRSSKPYSIYQNLIRHDIVELLGRGMLGIHCGTIPKARVADSMSGCLGTSGGAPFIL